MSHCVRLFWVGVSCGVLCLTGCKDKTSPAPSSSEPVQSVQAVSPASSETQVTGIPVNKPGMFRDASVTVAQIVQTEPMDAPIAEERARVVVTPGSPATLEAGVIRVDVPAGLVEAGAALVVSTLKGMPKFPAPEVTVLKAWDLKLEGHTVLSQPVEMSVPLEYDKLGTSELREHKLLAAYWHPWARAWVSVPVRYDMENQRVVIETTHLTVFALLARPLNMIAHNAVYTDHFSIYYDKADLAKDTEVNQSMWEDKVKAEAGQGIDPVGMTSGAGATIKVKTTDGVPPYAEYIARAFEYARTRFKLANLPVSENVRQDLYVGVNAPLGCETQRGKLFGMVWVSPDSDWKPSTIRRSAAHEFFHVVQSRMLGLALMSMNYRTWLLEAQAEYATRYVWEDMSPMAPMCWDFFIYPLTTMGKSAPGYSDSYAHEYGASRFIQYVVETRRLMSFGEFVRETLDTPAGLLTMEELSAPTFGATKALGEKIEAFDDYTVSVTFDKIFRVLLAHKASLSEVWQGFMGHVLFDPTCDWMVKSDQHLMETAGKYSVLGKLHPGINVVKSVMRPCRHGGGDVWAVLQTVDPVTKTEPKATRQVEFKLEGPVPELTWVNLFVLKDGKRSAIGAKPVAELTASKPARTVALGPKDVAFVVATHTGSLDASITVVAREGLGLGLEVDDPDKIVTGVKIQVRAVATNVPKGTPLPLYVRWTRGEQTGITQIKTLDIDGRGVTELELRFLEDGEQVIQAELLPTASALEPMAEATLTLNVDEDQTPSILLEARSISVEAGKEYEFVAQVNHAPKGATYTWWAYSEQGYRIDKQTDLPKATMRFDHLGKWGLNVSMGKPSERAICQDHVTVTVGPTEDLEWLEDLDHNGNVRRRWQARVGQTWIRHGQFIEYHDEKDVVRIKATYENGRASQATWYFKNGAIDQVLQMDPNEEPENDSIASSMARSLDKPGRPEGECLNYYEDGKPRLKAMFKKGLLHGPYELYYYGIADWNGHRSDDEIGRYENGKREGEWKFYEGSEGKRCLGEECSYKDGLKDGPFRLYSFGELCRSGTYRKGKFHGTITSFFHGKVNGTDEYRDGEKVK